ncbi:hypothetical protein CEXT_633501 [Caerostris extrusa]|uniref:Uncharacterized protein n=1 Tax=Caerostris extrusa TaxID=172846 RepID=A0AAV4PK26_CAEEX|nr:hypothetical protein CEXT_633501 [Caerostris extrusa]
MFIREIPLLSVTNNVHVLLHSAKETSSFVELEKPFLVIEWDCASSDEIHESRFNTFSNYRLHSERT